jgi:hypothetical protein
MRSLKIILSFVLKECKKPESMLFRSPPQRLLFISLLLLIAVTFAIRLNLAAIPLERDEGEYAYIAQLIREGSSPYKDAYAFKFPGIYLAYTLIIEIFGASDQAIRFGLGITIIATLLVLHLLVRKLLTDAQTSSLYAIATYAVLSLGSSFLGLSANAEHFVVFPATVGFLLLVVRPTLLRILLAGVCLGIAVSIKQQGAAFILGGTALLIYQFVSEGGATKTSLLKKGAILLLGVSLPIVAFCLWIRSMGAWDSFTFWCFSYARFYGSMWTWEDAVKHFMSKFGPILLETFPILILSAVGLFLAWKNNRRYFWTALILLLSGFLATIPGWIFRPHYFIFILPGCALAAAFAFRSFGRPWEWIALAALFYPLIIQGDLFFSKNPEDACRVLYPRNAFPEAKLMSEWIAKRSDKNERIAVLGSEPQIYFYAQRRASIPHIYMYPLLEPQPYAEGLQHHLMDALEKNPPRLLVHVRVPNSWIAYSNSELQLIRWIPTFLSRYDRIATVTAAAIPDVIGERELILYERKK